MPYYYPTSGPTTTPTVNTYPTYQGIPSNNVYPYVSYAPFNSMNSYAVKNQSIVWVQGRAGAEAYQAEPGTRVVLFDSNEQVFYIKEVGLDGRPNPLMAFRYEAIDFGNVQNGTKSEAMPDMSKYVTKEDFDKLTDMYSETKRMVEDMTRYRNEEVNSMPREAYGNGKSTLR